MSSLVDSDSQTHIYDMIGSVQSHQLLAEIYYEDKKGFVAYIYDYILMEMNTGTVLHSN